MQKLKVMIACLVLSASVLYVGMHTIPPKPPTDSLGNYVLLFTWLFGAMALAALTLWDD